MKYFIIEEEKRVEFNSLGECYLELSEDNYRFIYVESEDRKERFPEKGLAPEARIKGLIAWKLLNSDEPGIIKRLKAEAERDRKIAEREEKK